MAHRLIAILSIICFILLFLFVTKRKPYKFINYADAVQGRVTSVEIERQSHLYYLDHNTKLWYSFNEFMPPLLAGRRRRQLSQEEDFASNLGQKLRVGDYVSKQANSPLLTVQRGEKTSRWFCSTPNGEETVQKANR